jgi:hypothetical protein
MELAFALLLVLLVVLVLPSYTDRRARRLARDLRERELAELDAAAARQSRIGYIFRTYVA